MGTNACVIVVYPQNFFNRNYDRIFEVLQLKDLNSKDYSQSAWYKLEFKIVGQDFYELIDDLEKQYAEIMDTIKEKNLNKEKLKKLIKIWIDYELEEYYSNTNRLGYINDVIDGIISTIENNRKNEFIVNRFLILRLENNQTSIYVNNRFFNQCKYLLLNIPIKNLSNHSKIRSIDEAASILDRSMEGMNTSDYKISPEVEFWGHCSNLQAWAENNYDTRILHRNLSFPLLRVLTESGDPIAKRVFKEEIARRIESNYEPVVEFLLNEGYLDFLDNEELDYLKQNESLLPSIKKYIALLKRNN